MSAGSKSVGTCRLLPIKARLDSKWRSQLPQWWQRTARFTALWLRLDRWSAIHMAPGGYTTVTHTQTYANKVARLT